MAVQIVNTQLGVRRVEAAYDAHGAPVQGIPGAPSALLPGKRTEQQNGEWLLALDPSLWPVRVNDRVVADDGLEWRVEYAALIPTVPLELDEEIDGIDLDIAFVRVTGMQVTAAGTEPADGIFVGRGDDVPPPADL